MSDRCDDLKAIRGYTDPKSFVRRDGSESLAGKDWTRRKEELGERAGGRCEFVCGGIRCEQPGDDPDHVICRSVKRDDCLYNLRLLCREHHILIDPRVPRWGKRKRGEQVKRVGIRFGGG